MLQSNLNVPLPVADQNSEEKKWEECDVTPEFSEEWKAVELMRLHPPRFTSEKKRFVFSRFLPNVAKHTHCSGSVTVARYTIQSMLKQFPKRLKGISDFTKHKILVTEDIYDYRHRNAKTEIVDAPSPNIYEFYVNFADDNLFGFYAGNLFAQDEVMTLEHPILCSVREKLLSLYNDKQKVSNRKYRPTCLNSAVVVLNAQRHGSFRKNNLSAVYGNRLAYAQQSVIRQSCERLVPPTNSHIIAMACRTCDLDNGNKFYKRDEIEEILYTAFTGFKAAKLEAIKHYKSQNIHNGIPKVYIHTGNWGCGAFGGNIELHALLQFIAASAAGVDMIFYHSYDKKSRERVEDAIAVIKSDQEGFEGCKQKQIAEYCLYLGYEWGVPNGT